ncbi:MAG TPA: hypothetical protein QGI71_05415 [Dehalococcoidia bacterium]|jgi:hypothetical protein|nr:hypothetical protein [Dehalococcoidia bacterium]
MSTDSAQPDGTPGLVGPLPELEPILDKLPWYGDLQPGHRGEMLGEVEELMAAGTTRDLYEELLERWADIAHIDLKRARFELLRASGILRE